MITELKEKLDNGIVEFTYTKKNGEARNARGTRCFGEKSIVGENFVKVKGTGTEKTGALSYWDLDKEAWRSLTNDSLISIDSYMSKEELLGENLF